MMKSESLLPRGKKPLREPDGPKAIRRFPIYVRPLVIMAVAFLSSVVGTWMASQVNLQFFPHRGPVFDAMLLFAVLAYILLMAIPFMPGIELGLGLISLFGAKGAVLAYVCTLIALSTSFFLGRVLSPRLVGRCFRWLHLYRATRMITELGPLSYYSSQHAISARRTLIGLYLSNDIGVWPAVLRKVCKRHQFSALPASIVMENENASIMLASILRIDFDCADHHRT